MRWGMSLVGVAMLSSVPSLVHAQRGRAVWLVVDAPSERCRDVEPLRGAVERLLGRTVFAGSEAESALRAEVAYAPGAAVGWTAEIVIARDGETLGSRRVDTPEDDCARLDDAVALVLALALDVQAGDAAVTLPPAPPSEPPPSEPPPSEPPPSESPPSEPLPSESPPSEAPPSEPPSPAAPPAATPIASPALASDAPSEPAPIPDAWLDVALGARIAFGRLGDVLVDVNSAVGVEIADAFALELAASFAPPAAAGPDGARVWRWLAGGELRARVPFTLHEAARLAPTLGLAVSRFEARALDAVQPITGEGALVELLIGADLRVPATSPLAGRLRIELGVPVLAQRLSVQVGDAIRTIYEAPPVFVRAALALDVWAGGP